jgi:hypothetical protein
LRREKKLASDDVRIIRMCRRSCYLLVPVIFALLSPGCTNAKPQRPDDLPPIRREEEQRVEQSLAAAIRDKDWQRVRDLLPRARDLNDALDAGLLTATAEANRNDILFYLLDDRDVDPNWRTAGGDQKTALMHAAEGGNRQG